jgi:hypothetical protein
MTCTRCGRKFADTESRCPQCGLASAKVSGMFQTSTVLISAGGSDSVYRSVDDVPVPLRTRLLKSTNGSNSATILIADRRGRKEIAKAMRNLPANAQRRLMQSIFAAPEPGGALAWLTPRRRKAILTAVALLALAAVGLVFTRL